MPHVGEQIVCQAAAWQLCRGYLAACRPSPGAGSTWGMLQIACAGCCRSQPAADAGHSCTHSACQALNAHPLQILFVPAQLLQVTGHRPAPARHGRPLLCSSLCTPSSYVSGFQRGSTYCISSVSNPKGYSACLTAAGHKLPPQQGTGWWEPQRCGDSTGRCWRHSQCHCQLCKPAVPVPARGEVYASGRHCPVVVPASARTRVMGHTRKLLCHSKE